MKICIPSQTKEGKTSQLNGHFGSAPYFTLYDSDTHEYQIISNSNAHHSHGQCHPLSVIGIQNIDALICRGMGRRAIQILQNAGIKVYLSHASTVEESLKEFQDNKLEIMDMEGACRGHGCH
jgi:predicted Fe-Mo cluster-binding NifX family protein